MDPRMSTQSNRFQDLRSLRLATLDSTLANAFVALVGGFLIPYIKFASPDQRTADHWLGIFSAMPSFVGIVQIFGAQWGRAFRSYKFFVAPGGTLWRLFHIPFIFLPLIAMAAEAKFGIMAVCVLLSAISIHMTVPVYNEWLSEMVPANSRGWYFSRRSIFITIVAATIGLLGGYALDYFKKTGQQGLGFSVIFGVGVVFGLASLIPYFMMADKHREVTVKVNFKEFVGNMLTPVKDRMFRRVLLFFGLFVAGQAFGGGLYDAYALESLKVDYTLLMQKNWAMALGNIAFVRMWGALADRYGNRPVLILLGLGLAITPGIWLIASPGHPYLWHILVFGHVYNGFIWGGVGVVQFNLLLATAKAEDRASYIGLAQALMAAVGGLSPLIGTYLFHGLASSGWNVVLSYKTVFATCMGIRLLSVFPLFRVREEGATDLKDTIKQIKNISPTGYLALGKLSSPDIEARETAMEGVASKKFSLASEEIINALHDPAPRVRRKAAQSLSRLSDPNSAEALIHMLRDHPDLVEDETIEALGNLGNPAAVPILSEYLESPRPQIRRAAAKALGEIGGTDAYAALVQVAAQEDDPDLRRAALQGLREELVPGSAGVIAQAVLSTRPSVRIAAAEAISELRIESAAPQLRGSLTAHFDEASSEVAYALGCVGTMSDAPQILQVASQCVSMITRRRCLMGVAALMGVERETYQLMLLSGMSRDAALLDRLRPHLKSSPELQSALDAYSLGQEREALQILAQGLAAPELKVFIEPCVKESFLVAALRTVKVLGD